jgi:hypothetical protein
MALVNELPTPETPCAIGRPSSRCLLVAELEELAVIAQKFGSTKIARGDGNRILKALMSETECKDEECVVCEILAIAHGTPYEAVARRIKELAFKPKGPSQLDALLDNFLLIHIGLQIENAYSDSCFGGVLTYDFMIPPMTTTYGSPSTVVEAHSKSGWKRLLFILNTDHRMGVGIHWVSLVVDVPAGEIQYTDSYGYPPVSGQMTSSRPHPPVTDSRGHFVSLLGEWIREVQIGFVRKGIPMRFAYNKTRHQERGDYSNCGVYAVVAINASAEGKSFALTNSKPISMETIVSMRERIYRRTNGYGAELPSIATSSEKK